MKNNNNQNNENKNFTIEDTLYICDNCHSLSTTKNKCPECTAKSILITRKNDFFNCDLCNALIVTTIRGDCFAVGKTDNELICFDCWLNQDDIK